MRYLFIDHLELSEIFDVKVTHLKLYIGEEFDLLEVANLLNTYPT